MGLDDIDNSGGWEVSFMEWVWDVNEGWSTSCVRYGVLPFVDPARTRPGRGRHDPKENGLKEGKKGREGDSKKHDMNRRISHKVGAWVFCNSKRRGNGGQLRGGVRYLSQS